MVTAIWGAFEAWNKNVVQIKEYLKKTRVQDEISTQIYKRTQKMILNKVQIACFL